MKLSAVIVYVQSRVIQFRIIRNASEMLLLISLAYGVLIIADVVPFEGEGS